MKPALIYDCEIIAAIPDKTDSRLFGIRYCAGWRDFTNMGISVIGAYDYAEDRYRVFCADNFAEFEALLPQRYVVSFNGIAFDDQLHAATALVLAAKTDYDLLVEVWAGAGLGPDFSYPTHAGYGLDAVCEANGLGRKTGHGARAPVLWQQGKIGQVIDYCLQDVRLTKRLFDLVIERGDITCPRTGMMLKMRRPE